MLNAAPTIAIALLAVFTPASILLGYLFVRD
jgi:hypothetical protein